MPSEHVIAENKLAYAIRDGFPVTPMRTLVIPKRHAIDFFAMTDAETAACNALLRELKASIEAEDATAGHRLVRGLI